MAFQQSKYENSRLTPGGSIATVREDQTGAHVFWVSNDGAIKHRSGGGDSIVGLKRGNWGDEETVYKPGAAVTGGIAALSRCQGHCEVFWVAGSNVMAAYRTPLKQWTTWTLPIGSYQAAPTSGIAAIAKSGSDMDIYWVSTQGAVCSASFNNKNGSWNNVFALTGPNSAALESSIVAISRKDRNHREVFWTTPQQGVRAAFSYDSGWASSATYEALPASSVDLNRGSLFALSSHQSRMGLWWITPQGAVMTKHFSDPGSGWGSSQTIAGAQEGASGTISVIDRRPSSDDLCYEVAWTRKDRTIGSARMTEEQDKAPRKWAVQTLVSEIRLNQGTLASVLENLDLVTLIYPSGEDHSKVLIGDWLEAGTAPALAQANLIQKGPALRSHLGVTLQGYHQVVAVSQANINATLKYHFDNDKKLLQFAYQDKPHEDKWTVKITGTLAPPTVRLLDRGNGLDEALFFLNFAQGDFQRYTRGLEKHSMAGWSIAFTVSFSQVKLSHIPPEIQAQIENPGSYSATQLLIDFATADIAGFSWDYSHMPPLKTDKDGDNDEKAAMKIAMEAYISNQLQTTGPHNILGYALKVKEGIDPPSTFTPKMVRLQVVDSKPISGVVLSEKALQNRSAFCFTEMTGAKDEKVEFPKDDLQWSGNWFYGSVHGTFALTRGLFLEKFLIPKLSKYNEQIMDLANETWYRATDPERKDFPWILSKGNKPGADKFKWTVIPRDNKGNVDLGPIGSFLSLFSMFERPTGRVAAGYQWKERYDRNTGFMKMDCKYVESQVSNVMSWNPGCGWLTIETAMTLIDSRLEADILSGLLLGGASIDKNVSQVDVSFTTNIKLSNIENGALSVAVDTTSPIVKANVSSWTSQPIKNLFNGDPAKRNSDLAQRVRTKVKSVFEGTGIRDVVQKELNGTEKFIFPGGGTFKMKDAIFNNAGDLAVALTYILKDGTIAVVEDPK
ncbi:MAG: hypothetical protein M1821_006942 [Bathelium mastoideum]|nr:MAG: hypothetical protein M1821_006942 [Bathelium mastoideum]